MRSLSVAVNANDVRFPERLMLNAQAMQNLLDSKAFDRLPRALREYVLVHPDLGDGAKLLYLNYLYPAACRNADFAVHRSAARIMADLGLSSSTFSRYCVQLETARLIHRVHRFAAGKRALVAIHVGMPYLDGQAMLRATHDRKARRLPPAGPAEHPAAADAVQGAGRPAVHQRPAHQVDAASPSPSAPVPTPPAAPVDIADLGLRELLGSLGSKIADCKRGAVATAPAGAAVPSPGDGITPDSVLSPAPGQPVHNTVPDCKNDAVGHPTNGQTTPSYDKNKRTLQRRTHNESSAPASLRRGGPPRLAGVFFLNATKPGSSAVPCARPPVSMTPDDRQNLDTWVRQRLEAMGYYDNDIDRLHREIDFAIHHGRWNLGIQGATRACVKLIQAGRWHTPRGMTH